MVVQQQRPREQILDLPFQGSVIWISQLTVHATCSTTLPFD